MSPVQPARRDLVDRGPQAGDLAEGVLEREDDLVGADGLAAISAPSITW